MSGSFTPGKKSTTDDAEKNRWSTRWETFQDACRLFGRPLVFDVCAEAPTSKCGGSYFGPDKPLEMDRDSLQRDWPDSWWCNPPFDRKPEFIAHAKKQQAAGRAGMMLLPLEQVAGWWRELDEGVIQYIPDGRIGFYETDGVTKKHGVNFPSALICFPAHKIGVAPQVHYHRTKGQRVKKPR